MSHKRRKLGDSSSLACVVRVPEDQIKNLSERNIKIPSLPPCLNGAKLFCKSSKDFEAVEKLRQRYQKRVPNRTDVSKKRPRKEPSGDFWSRVDSGEIDIGSELEKKKIRAIPVFSPVNMKIKNYEIITWSVSEYSYKTTPYGEVYYSPRFQDDKYIYRYVMLSKGVKEEAYRILKRSKTFLLTEHQILRELNIDLSLGWEHFMLYKNRLDELILRRRL
ncbi:uncharacterized protein TOT_030000774 [Theileria orientalis strain Shintoku]|uniref:Cyclin-dependent kinases regulatory subunit n=1 Tax=Theileria orientalis strain Shintoku TaxID=869250 RepID=J4CDP7_THEOR|nr:uncharacterized protein TOT_030000774 [Theileria orientalis strain Shintoku]PVC53015.1 hypothetical protein MACL_00000377 [Theileria orientalis]BAM41512.1 uncharacterized protein TOT_030000774 [Theileria orientalis strain Shintoku]|eukprot:XP_009691813.1 uncharacterized protein TOT_030000774 [Theileria orientalis strain Shintoku]